MIKAFINDLDFILYIQPAIKHTQLKVSKLQLQYHEENATISITAKEILTYAAASLFSKSTLYTVHSPR